MSMQKIFFIIIKFYLTNARHFGLGLHRKILFNSEVKFRRLDKQQRLFFGSSENKIVKYPDRFLNTVIPRKYFFNPFFVLLTQLFCFFGII